MILMTESTIQKQIIQYLSMVSGGRFVFFSVPNEALMFALVRFKVPKKIRYAIVNFFKQMGLLPGTSDIIIGHESRMYCVEVKDDEGTQSEEQVLFEHNVNKCGIPYEVVRSVGDVEYWLREWGLV